MNSNQEIYHPFKRNYDQYHREDKGRRYHNPNDNNSYYINDRDKRQKHDYEDVRNEQDFPRTDYYQSDYRKKRSYCYIVMPKNYLKYVEHKIGQITSDLRKEIKDISDMQYDYKLPYLQDHVFKLATNSIYTKALAVRIICEYLFEEMEIDYPKMTYLKISIVVPDNVIGFIIGIEGKNINTIRDESRARIEVFPPSNSKMRQIEVAGNPQSISKAAEKIFSIEEKYCNFNKNQLDMESFSGGRRDHNYDHRHSRSRSRHNKTSYDNEDRYDREKRKFRFKPREYDRNYRTNDREKEKGEIDNDISNTINPRPNTNISKKVDYPIDLENKSTSKNETKIISSPNETNLKTNIKKCTIDILYSINEIEKLKESTKNIWTIIEKDYSCKIEEKEMIVDNVKKCLITFTGTPEDNSKGIFYLQSYFLGSSIKTI